MLCFIADKKLFTPGPLGTSATVKSAMLRDLGSRDVEFINLVKSIRQKLVEIAGRMLYLLELYYSNCVTVQSCFKNKFNFYIQYDPS